MKKEVRARSTIREMSSCSLHSAASAGRAKYKLGPITHAAGREKKPALDEALTRVVAGTKSAFAKRAFAQPTQPSTHHRSNVMAKKSPIDAALEDLLYQSLETEQGGVKVYETAISCAVNDDLRKEWKEYLDQTRKHVKVMLDLLAAFGLDATAQPPSRAVVGGIGEALVQAMKKAKATLTPEQAQLVACEAVVLAETKDHTNWELLEHVSKEGKHPQLAAIKSAVEEVEEDEDHHLYHTKGWCRELWIEALGFPAVLPPPEEVKQVETAIGASRAEQARKKML
jgi:rubrerythrin